MENTKYIWNRERELMDENEIGTGTKLLRIIKGGFKRIISSSIIWFMITITLILSLYAINTKNIESSNKVLKDYVHKSTILNKNHINKLENRLKKIEAINSDLLKKNAVLKENNDNLKVKVKVLEEIQAVKVNYSYILEDGTKPGMTFEHLKFGIEQMAKRKIDPHLLYGVVMLESRADEKAINGKSTARGYGQFLDSTAKWVYEVKLNKGKNTYNHDMAFDGKTNLEMSAEYLAYLMEKNKGNVMQTCLDYNGRELGTAYYYKVNEILSTNTNTNLQKIEQKYKEDNNII